MELLRLFTVEPETAVTPAGGHRTASAGELDEATWHETEFFLADRLEREGDLAHIQAALTLCDAAGGRSRATLEELVLNRGRFPRSLHAVKRVRELLELPTAERPEGFWPRFLLEQFEEQARRS
jgi:hypothetical protein